MSKMCMSGRLARATLTLLVVFGLALGQVAVARADDKLGEAAIDTVFDQLSPDPVEEEVAEPAPADDAGGATEPAPEATASEPAPDASTEEAVTADDPDAAATTEGESGGEPAVASDDAVVASDAPADSEVVATAADAAPAEAGSISAGQPATDSTAQAVGDETERRNGNNRNEPLSLAQTAASNVLSGDAPLGGAAPAAAPAAEPVAGGLADDTARQVTSLQAAGQSLRPSTIAPRRNSNDQAANDADDNGTVVVNSLSDAGDQGKLAVHGNLVAGTLCDGSQFWSLDGGGTVNANGVNLSANGGTALTAAGGGEDNGAARGGAAGNGGSAHSSADGGIVVVDELVTGNNRGNEVTVGDQSFTGDCGSGVIDGGDSTTITNVNISADGGTAIADATGGDNNFAVGEDASAGNGGRANASADGGIVIVGSLILGNNEGNQVSVGGSSSGDGSGSGSGSGSSNAGCFGGSIDGGDVRNETNIDISADGGIAIADASGGDDNIALGEDASVGNGGRASADADGGLILAGDIISGNNQGNTISVECGGGGAADGSGTGGRVMVNGGTVLNQTNLSLSADGGTAIADASGGDDNVALGSGSGETAAGNGGRAESDASGGVIQVGNIVSGNNVGNVIALGANFAPVPGPARDDTKPDRPRKISTPQGKPTAPTGKTATGTKRAPAGRATGAVGVLPNTGTGSTASMGLTRWTVLPMGGLVAFSDAVADLP